MKLVVAIGEIGSVRAHARREYVGGDPGALLERAFDGVRARERVIWIHLDRNADEVTRRHDLSLRASRPEPPRVARARRLHD